ncbi:MAG: hypothetical protein DMF63_11845 [Acidobacteria bacterium]|nr:MAG: hypothetical protein DMF63_11845 [Acidobacteriota bacterium]
MRLWLISISLLIFAGSVTAQQTEFCSAFSEGTHTTGTIRVKALMTLSTVGRVDGGDSFLYSAGCNNGDYFAVTDFSQSKDNRKTRKFLDSLAAETNFILEVDVTGRLVNSFMPSFGHLSWARSEFKIDRIDSIVDVSGRQNLVRPDLDAVTPLTNLATSLKVTNTQLMLRFLGSSSWPDIDGMFDDSFIAVDPNDQTYTKTTYNDLDANKLFGGTSGYPTRFVTQPDQVTKDGNTYIASGIMGVERASRAQKKLRYENTYRITDESIRLLKSRFTKP